MDDLAKIAALCHQQRIKRFKCDKYEIELELGPSEEQKNAAKDMAAIMAKEEKVTDEDILMNPYAGMDN